MDTQIAFFAKSEFTALFSDKHIDEMKLEISNFVANKNKEEDAKYLDITPCSAFLPHNV